MGCDQCDELQAEVYELREEASRRQEHIDELEAEQESELNNLQDQIERLRDELESERQERTT